MIRKILIGFGVLVTVVLVGGIALPSTITVTRSITVQASPDVVYPMIATPRVWPQWSP